MDWESLRIGKNDRAALIGSTGCGKTTLARHLVEDDRKPYSVVYDPKISDNISGWEAHEFHDDLYELQTSKSRRLIFRPDVYESADARLQDEFFLWVYANKHRRIYIDEAYAIHGGTNPAFHLQAILSRGRERGISAIVATQRPRRIPILLLSESEHFYIFRLNHNSDRAVVYDITGVTVDEQFGLRNYEFIYYNCLTGERSGVLTLDLNAR